MTTAKTVKAGDQELMDFAANYGRNQQAAQNEARGVGIEYRYTPNKVSHTIKMLEEDVSPFSSSSADYLIGGKDSFSNLG